jgi:hypothetical protein
MNYNIEFKFLKSELWTKSKIEFYLKVKKSVYTEIQETDEYFLVVITEQYIYLGIDSNIFI